MTEIGYKYRYAIEFENRIASSLQLPELPLTDLCLEDDGHTKPEEIQN